MLNEYVLQLKRVVHNLKYCLRRTWGLNTNTLLILFKSIIVTKLYTLWCISLESLLQKEMRLLTSSGTHSTIC